MTTFKRFALGQLAVVIATFCAFWVYRTNQFIHTTLEPSEEIYAHHWGFQLGVGGLYLAVICAVTAGLTVLEYFVLRVVRSIRAQPSTYSMRTAQLISVPTVIAMAGVLFLGFVGLLLYVVVGEGRQVHDYRHTRARSDMANLEFALLLYANKYGHYPASLADLAPGPQHAADDTCFLVAVPKSPWGSPYQFEIEHSDRGDKIKLWTVPDQQTQERMHQNRFTNESGPNDHWPDGDLEHATSREKAGTPCASTRTHSVSLPE